MWETNLVRLLGCRNAVEKKTVLENLDLVLLVMDETVDGGCRPKYPLMCSIVDLYRG
jgi:hypothetical protein